MISLTYHPSSDPYHCAFRALRLLEFHKGQTYDETLFGSLDFYLLFPFLTKNIHMPRDLRIVFDRFQLGRIPEQYHTIPDSRRLFRQVQGVQREAYRNLAAA